MIATLEDLDEKALIQILTEPKNAITKQYQRLFEMYIRLQMAQRQKPPQQRAEQDEIAGDDQPTLDMQAQADETPRHAS